VARARKEAGLQTRRATTGDAKRLAELTTELGYPTTAKEMKTRISLLKKGGDCAVFVAESAGQVIGWIHVGTCYLLEMRPCGEVRGLIVADGKRSLGAGARLLSVAEEWARKHGCESMAVRSNVIRERAHAFYEREGYEHYKTQKAFRKPL
jgi:GNAT superfamily N-acetyltransferase